jgi:putative hemolysin
MTKENHSFEINIAKVLKKRAQKIEKYLPNFIIRKFEKFIEQDTLNDIIRGAVAEGKKDIDMAQYSLDKLGAIVEVYNTEYLPASGPAIVVANHPLGGLDGLALIVGCGKVRKDVKFIVNDILNNLPNFDNVFVGVNKHGVNSRETLSAIDEVYSKQDLIIIFPAGLVSRKHPEGFIQDLEWSKSFIMKARKYNMPIIPCYVSGQNSKLFYNFAKWRKKLGIKINLEMLFLPREMVLQNKKKIGLYFKPAIPANFFDTKMTPIQWANRIKAYIYSVKNESIVDFSRFLFDKV